FRRFPLSGPPFLRSASLAGTVVLLGAAAVNPAPRRLVAVGDAFVTQDDAGHGWTIGNSHIAATYDFAGDHQLVLASLVNPQTGRTWSLTRGADLTLTLNDQAVMLVQGATGLRFVSASAGAWRGGVDMAFSCMQEALE